MENLNNQSKTNLLNRLFYYELLSFSTRGLINGRTEDTFSSYIYIVLHKLCTNCFCSHAKGLSGSRMPESKLGIFHNFQKHFRITLFTLPWEWCQQMTPRHRLLNLLFTEFGIQECQFYRSVVRIVFDTLAYQREHWLCSDKRPDGSLTW